MTDNKKPLRVLYLPGPRTFTPQKWKLLQMGLGKKAPFDAAMAMMNSKSMKVDVIELHSWNLFSWIVQATKSLVYLKRYDAVFTCGLFLVLFRPIFRWKTPKLFVLIERIQSNTASDYLLLPFMRFCVRFVDKVICLSSLQPPSHALELHIPEKKVVNIRYGIDSEFFSPKEVYTERRFVLCVGDAYRDNKTLIDATKNLSVQVIRVSDNPKTLKNFNLQASTTIMYAKYVTLCNISEFQLRKLYELATVVVVPILQRSNQPAGLTSVLEAMAMGKPLIVTNGLSSVDYVVNGKTGIVVKSGNPKELRSAIMNLITDPLTSRELGDMARISIEERFTISHLMLSLKTEILHLLA